MLAGENRPEATWLSRLALCGCLAVGVAGCGGTEGRSPDASAELGAACPDLPAGVSASPRTIGQTVDLVNALVGASASPLTLPCFMQRLERPLAILGVNSRFSAQPADGPRSPRIFSFFGANDLIMSVVPAGGASDRLELAEYPMPLESIKAELAFPISTPISPTLPYDRIRRGEGTECGGCHRYEQPAPQIAITEAFISGVFKPLDEEIVPIPSMQSDAAACDPAQEPYRCAMLGAILGHGDVVAGAFPADAPTIYQ